MLRVAFAGTSEFAVPSLRALAATAHRLLGVLTQPDRPAGRGRRLTASPIKQLALELGVPIAQPAALRDAQDLEALARWQPELLVVVAYGLILPPAVIEQPRLGCVNVHASLLPRWRGAAPIQRALLAGDSESGITIIRMDAGLDTGPVLAQRRIGIEADATAATLQARLAQLGAELLVETLDPIERGRVQPQPQSPQGVCYAAKIRKSESRIDWRQSATQIARRVRAFNPAPVAETRLHGETLRIWQACVWLQSAPTGRTEPSTSPHAPAAVPGQILGSCGEGILVQCGEGRLVLRQLQRPGRQAMSARVLAQGLNLGSGQRFE